MGGNDEATPQPRADHPLRMSGRGVFYSFSFDLGPGLDIVDFADKMLRRNMAAVAGSPSRDDLRIPQRGVELDRRQQEAFALVEFLKVLHSSEFSWRQLFKYNRRLALRVLWGARFVMMRYFLAYAIYGQRVKGVRRESDENVADVPSWSTEAQDQIGEVVEGYANMLLNDHLLGAIRLRLEQQFYLPGYFEPAQPFIRIEMNRAYYWDRSHDDEPIEVSLMAHRSGICMLTFAMPVAKEFGVLEANDYLLAGSRPLDGIEISLPIFGKPERPVSLNEYGLHMWQQTHSDMDWIVAKVPRQSVAKMSPETVFNAYLTAIQETAGRKIFSEWRCNSTLFLGPPTCKCHSEEVKGLHADELSQLMVRARGGMPLQDDVAEDLLKNHLLNSNEELWLSAGHAIHTSWDSSKIDYIKDLYMIEPIESAIVQHRQLQAIDNRTIHTRVQDKFLFAAQEQLATGLPEYGRNLLVDINAPVIVEALAEKLRTPALYSRLNDRVKVLESVVNTRFTRKQSRRSLAISVIGVSIVVVLLLPRIDEFLRKAHNLSPLDSLGSAVLELFGTADRATVAIYAIVVIVTVLFFIATTVRIPRSRLRRRKQEFGFATRGQLTLNRSLGSPRDLSMNDGDELGGADRESDVPPGS
ncbi:hypothetical protein SBI67_25780 [Mycolicibacterium sp. 120266]|uniref:hypothetical protein n=1 Tax=Mycolicibacterium sp. 120266 TaxID=3090601 RepID=UPI00299D8493|nr:hypothetical protein [Mycolicibacterium sp. 120266]MDX1875545.1 hypothetical protein [Mycolicibacterium sp. 120266]